MCLGACSSHSTAPSSAHPLSPAFAGVIGSAHKIRVPDQKARTRKGGKRKDQVIICHGFRHTWTWKLTITRGSPSICYPPGISQSRKIWLVLCFAPVFSPTRTTQQTFFWGFRNNPQTLEFHHFVSNVHFQAHVRHAWKKFTSFA